MIANDKTVGAQRVCQLFWCESSAVRLAATADPTGTSPRTGKRMDIGVELGVAVVKYEQTLRSVKIGQLGKGLLDPQARSTEPAWVCSARMSAWPVRRRMIRTALWCPVADPYPDNVEFGGVRDRSGWLARG